MSGRADHLKARPAALEIFQWLSYLQYPAMLLMLWFVIQSGLLAAQAKQQGWGPVYDAWNYALLLAGVGVGLASLQDPRRTQNKLSLKVWQDPRKGKWMLSVIAAEALLPIAIGLVGAFAARDTVLSQLSLGLVAFGLGMIGLLKLAIEMFEHHRLDRHGTGAGMQAGGEA